MTDAQDASQPSNISPDADTAVPMRLEQQQIAGLWVPNTYEVWRDGVYRRKVFAISADDEAPPEPNPNVDCPLGHAIKRLQKVSGRPAYLSGIGYRVDDDRELIGLTYLAGAEPDDPELSPEQRQERSLQSLGAQRQVGPRWETLWVSHSAIADTRKIIELADKVFPVRTSNAKEMSDFLTDCYDTNVGLVRGDVIVRRAGHHMVNGEHGWLVGERWIGNGRVKADAGPSKLSKALHVRGEEQEWLNFTREHWERPNPNAWVIRWFLACSFAAPVLRHIGERTFFVHHYTQSGGGKCVDRDTLVLTKRGFRRISDLAKYTTTRGKTVEYPKGYSEVVGNRAITVWNGERWVKASHFFRDTGNTLRVRTQKGYEVTGTPEHPMWTPDGWVEIQKMRVGTKLQVTPMEFPEFLPLQELQPVPHANEDRAGAERKLDAPVRIDEPMGRLLGYLVADGWNAALDGLFSLSSDKEILDEVRDLVESRFECRTHYKERPSSDGGINYQIEFSHGALRRALEHGGLSRVTSPQKTTPHVILSSPKNVVREYLRAYMDCEGWFAHDRVRIEVTSASEQLSRETQVLLLAFGIVTSRSSHVDSKTQETYWTVKIDGIEDVLTFAREIGVVTSARRERLGSMLVDRLRNSAFARPTFERGRALFDEVESIDDAGEQEVFDLTIPDGHAFVANGLLSHNTLLSKLAQSAWGHPNEFAMALNRATQNAVTEVFRDITDLPLLLDELQGKTIDASDFVMQACTEEHKARVRQEGGMSDSGAKSWRTLIRTTGEQTLAGADKEDLGGQANRVLEVRHPGLEREHSEEIWQWLERPKHYGWAGIRFLQELGKVVNDPERSATLVKRAKEYRVAMAKYNGRTEKEVLAPDRHLAAIMLGEVLMLQWVYGFSADDAANIAFRDAKDIASNWLRMRDGTTSLWQRAVEYLTEHRHSNANLWADASTEAGRRKLSEYGSKTSAALIAAYNAGENGNELWFFPTAVNKELRQKFNAPGDRIWEELAHNGILDRGTDRLSRHRQISGVFKGKVLVVDAQKFFSREVEPAVVVDAYDLNDYLPTDEDEWYEGYYE